MNTDYWDGRRKTITHRTKNTNSDISNRFNIN